MKNQLHLCFVMAILSHFLFLLGCGGRIHNMYPYNIYSGADVSSAPSDVKKINIIELEITDYPKLEKLKNLESIRFKGKGVDTVDDEKLNAIAEVKQIRPLDILILTPSSPKVTDEGLIYISKMKSLKAIRLSNTSVTDNGVGLLSENLSLKSINIEGCDNVSFSGILALLKNNYLKEIYFSTKNLTKEQVFDIVGSFKNIEHCEIIDDKDILSENEILDLEQKSTAMVLVRSHKRGQSPLTD